MSESHPLYMPIEFSLTIAVIATFSAFPEFSAAYLSAPVMLVCIGLLGIPHGALDLQIYDQLHLIRNGKTNSLIGFLNYFIIMLLWVLGWAFVPTFAFWAFMAVSIYHFGEADLDYIWIDSPTQRTLLFASRGLLVLSLTMTSEPHVVLPIIQELIPIDEKFYYLSTLIAYPLLILQHFVMLTAVAITSAVTSPISPQFPVIKTRPTVYTWIREAAVGALYVVLFRVTGPLIGFAVYFGLWHSLRCIKADIMYFKETPNKWFDTTQRNVTVKDVLTFYMLSMPYTILGILTMVVSYMLAIRTDLGISMQDLWATFVMGISVLTGAHIWVVAALHWSVIQLDPFKMKQFAIERMFDDESDNGGQASRGPQRTFLNSLAYFADFGWKRKNE